LKADKAEATAHSTGPISREDLVELLNEDLAGEYQAIISYVIYSQVLKGAEYMNIAGELEKHAGEELSHALIISQQIDYLGGMPQCESLGEYAMAELIREILKDEQDHLISLATALGEDVPVIKSAPIARPAK
jgi:bacterioferritin